MCLCGSARIEWAHRERQHSFWERDHRQVHLFRRLEFRQVTGDDYAVIDSNLNTSPPAGIASLSGDANLDGIVTGDDYAAIDSNLGNGSSNPLATASAPSAMMIVNAPALSARSRRDERELMDL